MVTKLKQASIEIRQNKNKDRSPSWTGSPDWTSAQFHENFRRAMDFYRLESSVKDLKIKLVEWMHLVEYSKKDIDSIRKTKDKYFENTMLGVAACLVKGMPSQHPNFNNGKDTAKWLTSEITKVITLGAEDQVQDESPPVLNTSVTVNVQDRLRESSIIMSEELDIAIDSWIIDPEKFDPKSFKIINLLRQKGAKSAHARYIKSFFKFGYEELLELASGQAHEQLKESFKHRPRKHVKKLIEFYESIMAACDQISAEAKVLKKPRAKKIKPAEDLVKKLKFKLVDDKLGIVSVPAAGIIGAQAVAVYNTKTRKIGIYISKTSQGLNVKGASIVDYTEKSIQKTLRKPDIQLKEFKEHNTIKRVETWFEKIKSTDTKLTGRINSDIVILKIFK